MARNRRYPDHVYMCVIKSVSDRVTVQQFRGWAVD